MPYQKKWPTRNMRKKHFCKCKVEKEEKSSTMTAPIYKVKMLIELRDVTTN